VRIYKTIEKRITKHNNENVAKNKFFIHPANIKPEMKCNHENASDRIWFPAENHLLAAHPYCSKCGTFKNVSSSRGKRLGYFANVLARLREDLELKGYKVSKAQIRLIMLELERRGIDDVYALSYSKQKEIFIDIVGRFIRIPRERISSYL
jgi:hypothetical protein